MCRKLWGDDIINSLIWIFIRTGQEMFSEKMWNFQKCHNFLISYPIFIIFAPICREIFYAFFWNYGDSGLDFPFKASRSRSTYKIRTCQILTTWPHESIARLEKLATIPVAESCDPEWRSVREAWGAVLMMILFGYCWVENATNKYC